METDYDEGDDIDVEEDEAGLMLPAEDYLEATHRDEEPGWLYFVFFHSSRRWKIGFTSGSPFERVRGALTFTAEPVTLAASCRVTGAYREREVHEMLAAHRVDLPGRREIFEDAPLVRQLVDYVKANGTVVAFRYRRGQPELGSTAKTQNRVIDQAMKELREDFDNNVRAYEPARTLIVTPAQWKERVESLIDELDVTERVEIFATTSADGSRIEWDVPADTELGRRLLAARVEWEEAPAADQ